MSASAKGILEDDGVAGFHRDMIDGCTNGKRHGAKVHEQMIALRDGLTGCVVNGARVVEALFDIWRETGAAEGHSHLLGDGDEEIFEDFEFDWIETHYSH